MNFTPSKTIDRAGNLSRNQTEAEKKLWGYLHGGSLNGHKFTRQTPIAPHIVDFLCFGATISMFLRKLQASSMASFWNWKSVEIYRPSPLGSDYLICQALAANFILVSLALALSLTSSLWAKAMRMTILGFP